MQIHVVGTAPAFSAQVKAYAEYKVFSRLAPLARRIGVVRIVLTNDGPEEPSCCAVTADLGEAGSVTSRVLRRQPIEAIDGAALALADAATRRLADRSPASRGRAEKGVRSGP